MNCCTGPQSQKREQSQEQVVDCCDEGASELNKLLDEDFENMHRVAQGICQSLVRPKDREYCGATLEELSRMNRSNSPLVKQNVNKFLRFYLKALRWTQKNQPQELYEKWYGEISEQKRSKDTADEQRVWMEQGKSFTAMKQFDDGSAIVYVATARDPSANWSSNGLKTLSQQQNNNTKK